MFLLPSIARGISLRAASGLTSRLISARCTVSPMANSLGLHPHLLASSPILSRPRRPFASPSAPLRASSVLAARSAFSIRRLSYKSNAPPSGHPFKPPAISPNALIYIIIGINGVVFFGWSWALSAARNEKNAAPIQWLRRNFTGSWSNLTSGRWSILLPRIKYLYAHSISLA